jgi:hypothetical protein
MRDNYREIIVIKRKTLIKLDPSERKIRTDWKMSHNPTTPKFLSSNHLL